MIELLLLSLSEILFGLVVINQIRINKIQSNLNETILETLTFLLNVEETRMTNHEKTTEGEKE